MSLSCYTTSRKFKFTVLAYCEMLWVLFFERFKCEIHGILEIFIIFSNLHFIKHFNERIDILLIRRSFIPDIADEGLVQ